MQVTDSVAIVTGASSGIGLATAELLSQKNAKVALVARSENKLKRLAKKLPQSLVVVADMAKESEIRKMVKQVYKHFGTVDILVNNAGRGYDTPIEKVDIKKLRYLIDLNYIGPIVAMQEVIPFMRKSGRGSIVNVSSGTSLMNIPNIAAYSSLKKALNGISLTAREELARDKISLSVVYPYITATNFAKNILGGGRKRMPQEDDSSLPPSDSAEYVAKKILEAIETEKSEIFAHEWMKTD